MLQSNKEQIEFWNGEAGAKWVRSQHRLDHMLRPVTQHLLRSAGIREKETVLDIGCGCGDTSLEIAKTGARITGIDISAPMLARAEERTHAVRLSNIRFLNADAANFAFNPEYDVLFSRFGVMFFSNPDEAFKNLKNAVKPRGRLIFSCWRDWRENEWVRIPTSAIRPHLPPQPSLGPEDPGPFSFADISRIRRILTFAGFNRIDIKPFDASLELGDTVEEALEHVQECGPVSRMLNGASLTEKAAAAKALEEALAPLAGRSPFTLGGSVWIVSASG